MTTLDDTQPHGSISTYSNHGCRCTECRKAWRERARERRSSAPSQLALTVARLEAELDAAEAHIDALREERDMLQARIDELEGAQ